MTDPRIAQLAKVLIHYSLEVKPGDWMQITGTYLSEELMRAAYIEALKVGAHPIVDVSLPGLNRLMYEHASPEQLAWIAPSAILKSKKMDKYLFILGGWNSKEMTSVPPEKVAIVQKAQRPLFQRMMKRTAAGEVRWVGTQYPTDSAAQDAEMSSAEYAEFVLTAGKLDKRDPIAEWRKVSVRQQKLVKALKRIKVIRIVGRGTDISFRVAGRTWVNCDGKVNFPDGEIFTGPIEDSAEGQISFAFPAFYAGREVEDVRLTFKGGKVVDAQAGKGAAFLYAMLDSDPGARRVGELAFGTNYAIKRFTKNTLFDEKIGGTVHVALGASIPESGGRNKSGIHWDMVCDTRKGFTIYGDDRPIHKNGKFLI